MSSALCVFIHASETGHAEGVPIVPSRGRSVEFPLKGNHGYMCNLRRLPIYFFGLLFKKVISLKKKLLV